MIYGPTQLGTFPSPQPFSCFYKHFEVKLSSNLAIPWNCHNLLMTLWRREFPHNWPTPGSFSCDYLDIYFFFKLYLSICAVANYSTELGENYRTRERNKNTFCKGTVTAEISNHKRSIDSIIIFHLLYTIKSSPFINLPPLITV